MEGGASDWGKHPPYVEEAADALPHVTKHEASEPVRYKEQRRPGIARIEPRVLRQIRTGAFDCGFQMPSSLAHHAHVIALNPAHISRFSCLPSFLEHQSTRAPCPLRQPLFQHRAPD